MATSASRDGVPAIWLRRWSHRQQESEVSFPFLNPRWVITHPSWDIKLFHRYLPFDAPMSLHWYGHFQYSIYKCEPQLHGSGLQLRHSTSNTRYSCTCWGIHNKRKRIGKTRFITNIMYVHFYHFCHASLITSEGKNIHDISLHWSSSSISLQNVWGREVKTLQEVPVFGAWGHVTGAGSPNVSLA